MIKDIKNLSEHEEEEDYYKPVTESNFQGRNYIEYENKMVIEIKL